MGVLGWNVLDDRGGKHIVPSSDPPRYFVLRGTLEVQNQDSCVEYYETDHDWNVYIRPNEINPDDNFTYLLYDSQDKAYGINSSGVMECEVAPVPWVNSEDWMKLFLGPLCGRPVTVTGIWVEDVSHGSTDATSQYAGDVLSSPGAVATSFIVGGPVGAAVVAGIGALLGGDSMPIGGKTEIHPIVSLSCERSSTQISKTFDIFAFSDAQNFAFPLDIVALKTLPHTEENAHVDFLLDFPPPPPQNQPGWVSFPTFQLTDEQMFSGQPAFEVREANQGSQLHVSLDTGVPKDGQGFYHATIELSHALLGIEISDPRPTKRLVEQNNHWSLVYTVHANVVPVPNKHFKVNWTLKPTATSAVSGILSNDNPVILADLPLSESNGRIDYGPVLNAHVIATDDRDGSEQVRDLSRKISLPSPIVAIRVITPPKFGTAEIENRTIKFPNVKCVANTVNFVDQELTYTWTIGSVMENGHVADPGRQIQTGNDPTVEFLYIYNVSDGIVSMPLPAFPEVNERFSVAVTVRDSHEIEQATVRMFIELPKPIAHITYHIEQRPQGGHVRCMVATAGLYGRLDFGNLDEPEVGWGFFSKGGARVSGETDKHASNFEFDFETQPFDYRHEPPLTVQMLVRDQVGRAAGDVAQIIGGAAGQLVSNDIDRLNNQVGAFLNGLREGGIGRISLRGTGPVQVNVPITPAALVTRSKVPQVGVDLKKFTANVAASLQKIIDASANQLEPSDLRTQLMFRGQF